MRGGDYYGSAVNRSTRLRSLAHGGQTVISGSTHQLVQDTLPAGISLRDMGLHGLKDLTRPEHVFQVDTDGLADEFPPLRSLDAVRHNLPTQLNELIGRERELAELADLLRRERLVTILAPGGTGKTRLAVEIAAEVSDAFPDGVFLVQLAPVASPDAVSQAIAEAINVSLSPPTPTCRTSSSTTSVASSSCSCSTTSSTRPPPSCSCRPSSRRRRACEYSPRHALA